MEPLVVTETLDLHGFFPEQVRDIVTDFIDNAVHLGLRRIWEVGAPPSCSSNKKSRRLNRAPAVIRPFNTECRTFYSFPRQSPCHRQSY